MSLTEVQTTIAAVADQVGPSVVAIGRRPRGSGLVVDGGRVLTNAHNLRGTQTTISFLDGRSQLGEVVGADLDADLAVLEVDTGSASFPAWGEGQLDLGAPVVALANPGGRGLRVTVGYVSGLDRVFRGPRGRRITGSIEHTAPLLPGASGGPIVDPAGRLLGINTNRLGEGFYLSIPADESLRATIDRLASGVRPARARLGVGVAPAEVGRRLRRAVGLPEADGLLVRMVVEDGPAARAGIREGDLITAVGGQPIGDADALYRVLDAREPGQRIGVTLLRGVDDVEVEAVLAAEE